jgi:hypothetical protein
MGILASVPGSSGSKTHDSGVAPRRQPVTPGGILTCVADVAATYYNESNYMVIRI